MTTTDKTKALLAAPTPGKDLLATPAPGPWACDDDTGRGHAVYTLFVDVNGDEDLDYVAFCDHPKTAALIVHLRNTAEHYVAVAECLREVIARVDAEAATGEEWTQSPEDAALEKRAREALRALDAAGGGE